MACTEFIMRNQVEFKNCPNKMIETSNMQISITLTVSHKLSPNCNNNKINYFDNRHRSQQKIKAGEKNQQSN